jgi:Spy/CpxP family protein refolding chaperone
MTIRSRKWMYVTLLLILVLGMSLGVLLDRFVLIEARGDTRESRDHREHGERFINHLQSELKLSPEQRESLEDKLATNREKAEAFWKETRSSYGELRKEFRKDIRDLLTPDQQKRYDELLAAEDARRRERRQKR